MKLIAQHVDYGNYDRAVTFCCGNDIFLVLSCPGQLKIWQFNIEKKSLSTFIVDIGETTERTVVNEVENKQ